LKTFQELKLSEPLMRAIAELGYETPSPIQAQTLPILLGEPTDFIGLAATGTGKTAAFSIPMLEKIDPKSKTVPFTDLVSETSALPTTKKALAVLLAVISSG
jgi:ATP-dependent RNA helicase DeaD